MKFTSEDLMKAMGLQVGDKVKINDYEHIFEVVKEERGITLQHIEQRYYSDIANIIDQDFEILPRPKRVGDLKCNYFKDCDNCPLRILFCDSRTNNKDTLYDILNRWNNEYVNFDQEIHDLLKARLDKVVE